MPTDPKDLLLIALAVVTVLYVGLIVRRVMSNNAAEGSATPTGAGLITGFVTNFFDTLGIGSFATTTAIFRRWKMVPDEKIPGTLNVGHTIPTIAQAFIFTKLVPVEPKTLILMIVAAVAGSFIGAGIVSGLPRRKVQLGMGLALTGAAILMALAVAKILPGGGTLESLEGGKLVAGMVGNFLLGALMTIGIGLYAPCMILIYLLGMNPAAAFPIMMGSCAFLMPVASAKFVKTGSIDLKTVLALAIGGLPAVIVAAYGVKTLSDNSANGIKVLVVLVVLYTAYGLLKAARQGDAVQN